MRYTLEIIDPHGLLPQRIHCGGVALQPDDGSLVITDENDGILADIPADEWKSFRVEKN